MFEGRLLTTTEIAEYCRVTTEGVVGWIKAGRLVASMTPGGRYRIASEDFVRFLLEAKMPVPPELSELVPVVAQRMGSTAERAKMKQSVLAKKHLAEWLERLRRHGPVYGPVARGERFAFDQVSDASALRLDYPTTILPLKKYFQPQSETLLRYDKSSGNVKGEALPETPFILLGVHPCDLTAIRRLDVIFRDGQPEAIYLKRRALSCVIGVTCNPDESCFCASVGSSESREGYDAFLSDIGQSFLVETYTARGAELLAGLPLTEANNIDLAEARKAADRCKHLPGKKIESDVKAMPLLCTDGEGLPFWEDIGGKCLSCGTCTMVCPTCYCFDVRDEMDLSLKAGARERVWDSCQLEDFAMVAGGHSFRKERTDRQKHRFYRKFRYLMSKYGQPHCVGCGRCIRQCVAKINIVEMANELSRGVAAM